MTAVVDVDMGVGKGWPPWIDEMGSTSFDFRRSVVARRVVLLEMLVY